MFWSCLTNSWSHPQQAARALVVAKESKLRALKNQQTRYLSGTNCVNCGQRCSKVMGSCTFSSGSLTAQRCPEAFSTNVRHPKCIRTRAWLPSPRSPRIFLLRASSFFDLSDVSSSQSIEPTCQVQHPVRSSSQSLSKFDHLWFFDGVFVFGRPYEPYEALWCSMKIPWFATNFCHSMSWCEPGSHCHAAKPMILLLLLSTPGRASDK